MLPTLRAPMTTQTRMPSDTAVSSQVEPLPIENAAPGLRIRFSLISDPTSSTGLARRQRGQRPHLGGLVEHEDGGGEPEQHGIQPPPAAGRDRGRRGRGGVGRGRQRRSCFILHGMHRVARGAAWSLSLPIGFPQDSQMP